MAAKTGLDRWNKKHGKKAADEQVIREAQAKSNKKDIMEKGEDIMKKATNNTEEVFAVIARNGMETFMNTWNNSMENVIRETVRTEVKSMVQEIVKEEMEAAVKGVFSGINGAMKDMFAAQMVEQVFRNPDIQTGEAEQEQIAEDHEQEQQAELAIAEMRMQQQKEIEEAKQSEEVSVNKWISDDEIPMTATGRISWTKAQKLGIMQQVFLKIVKHADEEGLNLERATHFQRAGGNYGGMYQKFNSIHKKETTAEWMKLINEYRELVTK